MLTFSVMFAVLGVALAVASRHPDGSWSTPGILMGVGFELVAAFIAVAIARSLGSGQEPSSSE